MCDRCWSITIVGPDGEDDVVTCDSLPRPCRCACHREDGLQGA